MTTETKNTEPAATGSSGTGTTAAGSSAEGPTVTGLLTRREAIARVSTLLGGAALVGQTAMLTACSSAEDRPAASGSTSTPDTVGTGLFSGPDIALLDEIAETILPETDTPGAKAAGVGAFMALMVTDAYRAPDQTIFREGLATIDARSNESFGSDFVTATPPQRLELLQALDTEQHGYMGSRAPGAPTHFFRMMKELALLGYFTSEIGYTQAMRYTESPGRFDPCVPYAAGEKIWANHA